MRQMIQVKCDLHVENLDLWMAGRRGTTRDGECKILALAKRIHYVLHANVDVNRIYRPDEESHRSMIIYSR